MRRALSAALQRLSRAVAPPHPAESHPAFYAALRRLGTPTARDLRTLAIHEAGHALPYAALRPLPPYVQVSLPQPTAADDTLGYVTRIVYPHELEDLTFQRWEMLVCLAGQAAEDLVLHGQSNGSGQDLERWLGHAEDYLSLCHEEIFYASPANPLQHASNQQLLKRLLITQRGQIREFLRINQAVLVGLAETIATRRHLAAADLKPFFAEVRLPEGFPLPDLG